MNYVFTRGEYVTENQAVITKDNRAFRYGDGFFESIRAMNGKALFIENHHARMVDSAKALHIEVPESLTIEVLRGQVHGLLQRNGINQGGRIRITFFRKSMGFYQPQGDELGYFIEAEALPVNEYVLNAQGKTVDIYSDLKKDINKLSMFKTLNCQLYVMASIFAREKGLDDALIQNMKGSIIESTSSNLFIVSNGVLYTPSLQDGCIAGTQRMNIINAAIENKIKVYECTLNPQHMLTADEVFLANATRGLEWVVAYRTKRYFNDMAKRLVGLINEVSFRYTRGE